MRVHGRCTKIRSGFLTLAKACKRCVDTIEGTVEQMKNHHFMSRRR